MSENQVVVKLDFSNAFNSLHRDVMLNAVADKVPEIYKFCHMSYSNHTALKFGDNIILSEEGPQQGDPLGPLLFCLSIHPLLLSLSSTLSIGFLDDVTLGGDIANIAKDVESIRIKGDFMGLRLNVLKCELIESSMGAPCIDALDHFNRLKPNEATLLGAPPFSGPAMNDHLESCCADLSRAIDRLKLLPAHDALVLLRACFGAPKVTHILRCAPCNDHVALAEFDNLLKTGVSLISNSNLTGLQMLQASLPVRDGGLGIRSVASLALSAFLASAASTRDLQESILRRSNPTVDTDVDRLRAVWSSLYATTTPSDLSEKNQSAWDAPSIAAARSTLNSSFADDHNKARLAAVSASHSGDWLHALPISSCGLRLDNEAIRVAVGLRLGINLCVPHPCPCGADVDARGTHGLACKRNAGRITRHHQLNDLVWRALSRAGIPSVKEPAGLSRTDGKRPDGITQIPWQRGKCAAWDVTVADTLAASYRHLTAATSGAAAENAATKKEAKYAGLASSYMFVPLAFETLGPINTAGIQFFSEIGRRLSAITGDKREGSYLFQRLSVTMQRFNAISFTNSFVPTTTEDH